MASLFSLTDEYQTVLDMLGDSDVDEQLILDTLEGLDGEIESKADNYAWMIKSLNGDVATIESEISRLTERKQSLTNRSKWLKNNLESIMRHLNKTKFKTPYHSFNIQRFGGLQPLTLKVDVENLPEEYLINPDPIPNNTGIREYMKENNLTEFEYAKLEPRKDGLVIR